MVDIVLLIYNLTISSILIVSVEMHDLEFLIDWKKKADDTYSESSA